MKSELAEELFEVIEARSPARPTPMEFEMAYQARVAMDRIIFAIRHTEQFGSQAEPMREVGRQLLDALQRLEIVDRRFQIRSQVAREANPANNNPSRHNFDVQGMWSSQRPDGQCGDG
jgi:hypothetical protein